MHLQGLSKGRAIELSDWPVGRRQSPSRALHNLVAADSEITQLCPAGRSLLCVIGIWSVPAFAAMLASRKIMKTIPDIRTLAVAAGLDKALSGFPDEIIRAARLVVEQRAVLKAGESGAAFKIRSSANFESDSGQTTP